MPDLGVGPRTFIRFAHHHDVTAMALTRRHSGPWLWREAGTATRFVSDHTSFCFL